MTECAHSTIADARERQAAHVSRAANAGTRPILTRRGRPVAAIHSIDDLIGCRNPEPLPRSLQPRPACEEKRDEIAKHCIADALSLSGSALRGDFTKSSEVDLHVEPERDAQIGSIGLGRLEADPAHCFGWPIDLAPQNRLRPILREDVLVSALVLYAS